MSRSTYCRHMCDVNRAKRRKATYDDKVDENSEVSSQVWPGFSCASYYLICLIKQYNFYVGVDTIWAGGNFEYN